MATQPNENLHGFDQWLRRSRMATDRQIPYLVRWVQRFLRFQTTRSPESWRDTQQVFLHRYVYCAEFGNMKDTVRARRGRRLPVVLTVEEVRAVFDHLKGLPRIMLGVIYGGSLRLNELVQLRMKDLDFEAGTITVRVGKGD